MKRLYIAALLLVAVTVACVLTHRHQHRQIDEMLQRLDRIEDAANNGDVEQAFQLATEFADEYGRVSDRISCYIAHSELRESRETVALLPTLLQRKNEDEWWMQLHRLRAQLIYLRQVDDPHLQNIL